MTAILNIKYIMMFHCDNVAKLLKPLSFINYNHGNV